VATAEDARARSAVSASRWRGKHARKQSCLCHVS
jgi:hypothetical protein